MEKKCCFIILHYQTIKETLECIQSIKNMNDQNDIGIIVVDNASPNGSGKTLQTRFENDEQVLIVCNERNEGFSRGNNIGCRVAQSMWNPSFYIITNNDTIFQQKNFLELISREYQRSDFAVLGPDILRECDHLHQSPIAMTPPTLLRVDFTIVINYLIYKLLPLSYGFMKKYYQGAKTSPAHVHAYGYDEYQKNVCLMGACMIFSKAFVEKKQCVFEPETQFYYEEYILSLYCRENHQTTIYNPDIKVLHTEGAATENVSVLEKEKIKFRIKNILEAARIYRNCLLKSKRKNMHKVRN